MITLVFYSQDSTPHQCNEGEQLVMVYTGPGDLKSITTVDRNKRIVTATVRKAGTYEVRFVLAGTDIGERTQICIAPGRPDFKHCVVESAPTHGAATVYSIVNVRICDEFGNPTPLAAHSVRLTSRLMSPTYDLKNLASEHFQPCESYSETIDNDTLHCLRFSHPVAGVYSWGVSLRLSDEWQAVRDELYYIAMTDIDAVDVAKATSKKDTVYFESVMLSEGAFKNYKVYCYLSRRHLSIRYFYLGMIPSRLQTFRISAFTCFKYPEPADAAADLPVFAVSERGGEALTLGCKRREALLGTFYELLSLR